MGVVKKDPTFFCDCCKRIMISSQHLANVKIPCRLFDDKGENYTRMLVDVKLCDTCTNKFWEASDENFAVVECSDIKGIEIFPHFEVGELQFRNITWPKSSDKAADESEVVKL
ncbi:MAG: hypothetical protein IKB02_04845 [Clostridia bacterium]|nr:hypothetical protein [Clostridia bacterium]